MANENLLAVADGDTQTAVIVDLRDYEPGENRVSGHVAPGNYEAEILSAAWVNKKDRPGKNLSIRFAALPARVSLRIDHPAPVGNAGDKSFDTGLRNLRDLVYSIATATGRTEKVKAGPIEINPQFLVGKHCFVRVDDEQYNGKTVSKIAWYITKAQFDASPGADEASGPVASRPQPTIPEVLPGGNSGPGAKAAIDKVLGF